MKVQLAKLAHARSGDKADWVDFGLFAWNEAGYRLIAREVTAERVQAHFAPWLPGAVQCWALPNILALKLVLHVDLGITAPGHFHQLFALQSVQHFAQHIDRQAQALFAVG